MARRTRRNPSKGWHKVAPRTKAEREALPVACFLVKRGRKYPICARRARSYKPDCRGLLAAVERAARLGHRSIVAKAKRIAARKSCSWER